MLILGITHPISSTNAAVLIRDGKIISAVEEERFVRIKQAPRMFPFNAIEWCINNAKINHNDVDIIAIGWDGFHNKEEIFNQFNENQEDERNLFLECISLEKDFLKYLKKRFVHSKIRFVRHHIAHAASACYLSGFDKSLFLTLDARGEYESGILGIYDHGNFEILRRLSRYESLGNLYSQFTSAIGFRGHFDEGKTMGLAPYGKPIESMKELVHFSKNGKIVIDHQMISNLENKYSFSQSDPTKDERKNLAATVQYILEKTAVKLVEQLTKISHISKICLAGGTALNIDMNSKILAVDGINEIFIQPASSDAGTALGAALFINHQFSNEKINPMRHAYFGPKIHGDILKKYLDDACISYNELSHVPSEIAKLLADNKIIAWVQGRAEFGPRALGARSLLANPTNSKMWLKVNQVKGREYWRPLAPSVIEEDSSKYFEGVNDSPFMLLSSKIKEDKKRLIPAVSHVDQTARPQTVSKNTNLVYWELLQEFKKLQGVPVLINTSLNLRGDPIVNTIQDCLKTFYSSNIDYLCIDNYLISKDWLRV